MARIKNVRRRIKVSTILVEGYNDNNEIVRKQLDVYGEPDFDEIRNQAYRDYGLYVGRIIEQFVKEAIYQMPEAAFFKVAAPVVDNDESEDE